MRLITVSLLACTFLGSCQSIAGTDFVPGMRRASVSVSYADETLEDEFGTELDLTELDLGLGLGYFVNKNVELGGTLGFKDTEQSIGAVSLEGDILTAGGYARFYFQPAGNARPYAAVGAGFLDGSAGVVSYDGFYYGVGLGVATFVTEHTMLDFSVQKAWSNEEWSDPSFGAFDVDRDSFGFFVGISFLF